MIARPPVSALGLAAALCAAAPASALPLFYDDPGDFTAALGGVPTLTEDFEGFAVDTEFRTAPLDVGPFTLANIGADSTFHGMIDVAPYVFSGVFSIDGTAAVFVTDVDEGTVGTLTFDAPVYAVGFDLADAGSLVQVNGATGNLTAEAFFGIVDPDGIETLTFVSPIGGDGFSIDNVVWATDFAQAPLPAAAPLLAAALGGLALLRRRR